MSKLLAATRLRAPSSRVLQELLAQAPADFFTLAWLTSFLRERSFGIMLLFAGLLGTIPFGSTIPGLMLLALATQLIAGWSKPVLPGFISHRPLPTQLLVAVGRRAIPVLLFLERAVHPRWPGAFDVLKHGVGVLILLLTAALLLTPVPLSNVAPAVIISLMSLSYVEEDGLLLTLSVAAATAFMFLILAARSALRSHFTQASFFTGRRTLQSANFISSLEQTDSCVLYPTRKQIVGGNRHADCERVSTTGT
jgi:hypothetical protein